MCSHPPDLTPDAHRIVVSQVLIEFGDFGIVACFSPLAFFILTKKAIKKRLFFEEHDAGNGFDRIHDVIFIQAHSDLINFIRKNREKDFIFM